MRAIVTTDQAIQLREYEGYTIVSSLKELFRSDVTDIVLHTPQGKPQDIVLDISALMNNRPNLKLVYINDNPVSLLRMAIDSLNGVCLTNTACLESADDLNSLFEDYALVNIQEATMLHNIEVLQNFIGEFISSNGNVSSYNVTSAKRALTQLREEAHIPFEQARKIGTTAMEVLNETQDYLRQLNEQYIKLQEQLKLLEGKPKPIAPSFTSGTLFYPTVEINNIPLTKILYIKEYSPCRYLTSFLLAYRNYLNYKRNKRVKLVFVIQRGTCISKRYDFATMISQESAKDASLFKNDIIAVNVPQKQVIERLLNKDGGNYDIVILVDRLYSANILKSSHKNFKKLDAISGKSDITRYGLNTSNVILPHISLSGKEFGFIPIIKSYPAEDENSRYVAYQHACGEKGVLGDKDKSLYDKLDSLIGI